MNEKNEYGLVLAFMGMVFIEIRASDNPRTMKFLADVCHNVPAMIANGSRQEEVLSTILRVAKRYDAERHIKKYITKLSERESLPLKWPEN